MKAPEPTAKPDPEALLQHRILIVHPPSVISQIDLGFHKVSLAPNLDAADLAVAAERPDMVVLFADKSASDIEYHGMTWLVEGFKGKLILFDPHEEVTDPETLVKGQVVDNFIPGPVSIHRFTSILQSNLLQDTRYAAPRAMTTYDLFRNLFDRSLNALFFFTETLDRCIAANLKAEELTGRAFAELKRMAFADLCGPENWEHTLRTIRRAKHRYFDARGRVDILHRSGDRKPSEFSCSYFQFGRRYVVKIETQVLDRSSS